MGVTTTNGGECLTASHRGQRRRRRCASLSISPGVVTWGIYDIRRAGQTDISTDQKERDPHDTTAVAIQSGLAEPRRSDPPRGAFY